MLKNYIKENMGDVVFYRNSFRRFIYVAIFLLIVNYIALGMLYYKLLSVKIPPNFATTSDGRLIEVYPD